MDQLLGEHVVIRMFDNLLIDNPCWDRWPACAAPMDPEAPVPSAPLAAFPRDTGAWVRDDGALRVM